MAGTTIGGRARLRESTRARHAGAPEDTTRIGIGMGIGGTGAIVTVAGIVTTAGMTGVTGTSAGAGTIARTATVAATGVWTTTVTDAVITPIGGLRGAAATAAASTTIVTAVVTSGITATAGAHRIPSLRFCPAEGSYRVDRAQIQKKTGSAKAPPAFYLSASASGFLRSGSAKANIVPCSGCSAHARPP